MTAERHNRITIGGIHLDRGTGGSTVTAPVCVYDGLTDEHVQEFWHYVAAHPEIVGVLDECRNKIAALLIAWGDARKGRTETKSK